MKVILTGVTGFIGQEVLDQCLQSPSITSVVALSRRELPQSTTQSNSKLKVVIMEDFTQYTDDVLQSLVGAEACIWSLGKASLPTAEEARRITFDYTLAAVKAFNQAHVGGNSKTFRFVYLSGKIVERDQTKQLWYMQEQRRMRGLLETELIDFASNNQDTFETFIVKPSMVLAKQEGYLKLALGALMPTVKVDVLANAMIDIATRGNSQQTLDNSSINEFRI